MIRTIVPTNNDFDHTSHNIIPWRRLTGGVWDARSGRFILPLPLLHFAFLSPGWPFVYSHFLLSTSISFSLHQQALLNDVLSTGGRPPLIYNLSPFNFHLILINRPPLKCFHARSPLSYFLFSFSPLQSIRSLWNSVTNQVQTRIRMAVHRLWRQ